MARIAVGVEYDGSRFSGWQTQDGAPTVQVALELALSRVADAPVAVVAAGRTDAGVHAIGQVAHFDTPVRRSARAWALGANSTLPSDISVVWAMPVPAHFHARYSAESRTYRYVILNRSARPGLAARRVTWIHRPLDHERMAAAAKELLGEHDFSSFRSIECQSRTPVRRIERFAVERHGDAITLEVTANAFLHHMVRNLAGLLIAVGRGERTPADAAAILAARDRARAPATAPADGLYLAAVRYPEAFRVPPPAARVLGDPL
jgi:tRNA pseudouridine38-40 synthase